jgi:cell wall-associated NlpC family hydrolase
MNEEERRKHDKDEFERDLKRKSGRTGKSGKSGGGWFWMIIGGLAILAICFTILHRCDILGPKTPGVEIVNDKDGDGIPDTDPNEHEHADGGNGEHTSSSAEDMIKGDIGVEFQGGIQPLAALVKQTPNKNIPKSGDSYANNVITYGKYFLGTPYEYGSDRNTTRTFDCSDFTRYAYLGALGMDLPKDSRAQKRYVDAYSRRSYTDISKAQKGDLLFFGNYRGYTKASYNGINRLTQTVTHVGIYMGNGQMLHTASAPKGVRIDSNILNGQYAWRFVKGGSVL